MRGVGDVARAVRRPDRGLRVVGLMSGTSLDGIDAALVAFDAWPPVGGSAGAEPAARRTAPVGRAGFADAWGSPPGWRVLVARSVPYEASRRTALHHAILEGRAADLCRLHARLGEWLAEAALDVIAAAGLSRAQVDLIGSHGQTVWHDPPDGGARGATLQLGCPATIAERTGIAVVSDFRARDMAAGGHGAPLVPWADRLLFSLPDRRRALQNIGGMANVTWLPARSEGAADTVAFDTGPGVALMDAAVELATNGRARFDRDGELAGRGRVREALLAELMAHPFFDRPPPRSTGRETFGRPFVEALAARFSPAGEQDWADLVRTLAAFTAGRPNLI